jgi:pilus assembly protein CpaD
MKASQSLAALLALGAIAVPATAQEVNKGLYSMNQPVVQRTDYVLDLPAPGNLPVAERGRLHAWFGSLGLGYGDRVAVDEPYQSAARGDVARIAAEYGLLLSDGAPVTAGQVQPGTIRVIVTRSFASVPGCPHWSNSAKNNATSPNYGCATNSNLAAMIADPSDLVLGQAGSGTDGNDGVSAIKAYRSRVPTGINKVTPESTASGGK